MTAIRAIAGRRRRPTRLISSLPHRATAEALNAPRGVRRYGFRTPPPPHPTHDTFSHPLPTTAHDDSLLPAYRAEFLNLPSESDIARELARNVDTEAVHVAREALRSAVGSEIRATLAELYDKTAPTGPYSPDPDSAGVRSLRSAVLDLLI